MIANFHYLAKVNGTRYPALHELIGGYFHEDYDLIGGTFNEIIQAYIEGTDPAARKLVVKEVERFKRNSEGDFDTAYRMEFIDHIDFSYWGFTYVIFINEVRKLLKRSLRKKRAPRRRPSVIQSGRFRLPAAWPACPSFPPNPAAGCAAAG